MEVIKTIEKQLEWYYKNSHISNIEDLINLQDKLSVNSYYLAQLYSEVYNTYLEKVYNHKTKKIKSYLTKKAEKIQEKQITDKLAERFAEDESLTDYADELFWEWEREKYRVLLSQVNKVLDSIRTRISYLKIEFNNK